MGIFHKVIDDALVALENHDEGRAMNIVKKHLEKDHQIRSTFSLLGRLLIKYQQLLVDFIGHEGEPSKQKRDLLSAKADLPYIKDQLVELIPEFEGLR